MSNYTLQSRIAHLVSSPLFRICLLGGLVLLLLIPIRMVAMIIEERQHTRNSAMQEVSSKWGGQQVLLGPKIFIPYLRKIVETLPDGKEKTRTETQYATFLPEDLEIKGTLDSEVRYRGIYEVPLYSLKLAFNGSFKKPDFSGWEIAEEDILWNQANLLVGCADVRGIQNQVVLEWNEGAPTSPQPGVGEVKQFDFEPGLSSNGGVGIHVPLHEQVKSESATFSFNLSLNGCYGVRFTPLGKSSVIRIESDWKAPSFNGSCLPTERILNAKGFTAEWRSSVLGRNYPQKWISSDKFGEYLADSQFGVDLITPVDHYRMAQRSVKYAILFLVMTFVTLWLFEVLGNLRIHPVQYLLIGAAMCLFYLLQFSLSEHLGFDAAYALATLAVVLVTVFYCYSVLHSPVRAGIVCLILVLLYGYLYVVLGNQDYALLIGSIGLFASLSAIMYLTRHVDWSRGK
jgi:inner membrane protein